MSVLRLLTVYNEKDIIRENIEYYISQGIESVVLDNYSKDGTYEILKEYEGRGIRWIERVKTQFYEIFKLNTILLNLALKYTSEEFFIWADADEIICPFDTKYNLLEIIPFLFKKLNVDTFEVSKVEFYHTEKNSLIKGITSIKDLKYFNFEKSWKYPIFRRKKGLKGYLDTPIYLDENGNELTKNYEKYLFYIKHYPFRSLRQAKKKIYRAFPKNVLKNGKPDKKFINYHYLCYRDNLEEKIIIDKTKYFEYKDFPDFYVKFMIERYPELENFFEKIYNLLEENI